MATERRTVTYLTKLDLAARWQISKETLSYWRQTGAGPRAIKIGRHVRYDLADVEAWEAEQKAAAAEDRAA